MRALPFAALPILLASCSPSPTADTDAPVTNDDVPAPSVDAPTDAGGPTESFSVTFGPVNVAPGVENTQCVVVRLGNPAAAHIGTIHNVLSEGSHHFIVYRTNDTVEQPTPFDCQPFVDTLDPTAGSPLMITQRREETLVLPTGVAFDLEANQMIRLEMHFINTTDAPLDVQATSTFTTIPDAVYENAADFLFIGNPDINIDPRSTAVVGPTYFPLPAEYAGVNFFGITGHTHQYGVNVSIAMATAETGGTDTMIYDYPDWNWAEPDTARLDPAVVVPDGGGFRFSCEYDNVSTDTVTFGESANDEMCFFWAYYYPSRGARVCVHTDQVSGGVDLCCPGSALCSILSSRF